MFESQLPVLVALLAMGAGAKLATARKDVEPGGLTRLGPAVLVPDRFRTPAMIFCAGGELFLATGLLFSTHPFFRWGSVAFFALSTYVLWELRRRRPDAGCGCFGEVSAAPVGRRSLGRTIALTGMAIVSLWSPVAGLAAVLSPGWLTLAGLLVIAVLSPELEEAVDRLRYRAPCEQRPGVESVSLARLKSSSTWRAHADGLLSTDPYDSWRELCWRFFVFQNHDKADVVFAVYLSGRHPAVRVAVVGTDDSGSLPEYTAVSA
ncbi:MauE/DoxX family redox-associated membrane protein [Nonomuraea sp. NPDC050556]|uniref:MauE/DoxX family redox-associated membrane protein n=1 Tax=Nonomuraea sp. NPDC050556 TaxID=3364369 RepID=UPI0037B916C5